MKIDFTPNLPSIMEDILNPDSKELAGNDWEWTTLEAARQLTIKELDEFLARSPEEDRTLMKKAGYNVETWRYEVTKMSLFYELMKGFLPTKATDKESYTEELKESIRNTQECYRQLLEYIDKHCGWKLPAIRASNIIKRQRQVEKLPKLSLDELSEVVAKQLKRDGVKNDRGGELKAGTIKKHLLREDGYNI